MLMSLTRELLLVKEICRAEVDCNRKTVSTPLHAVVLPLLIVVAVSIKLLSLYKMYLPLPLPQSCPLFGRLELEDGRRLV